MSTAVGPFLYRKGSPDVRAANFPAATLILSRFYHTQPLYEPMKKLALLFAVILFAASGCSGKSTVRGTVKFSDGEPLTRGSVFFQDVGGVHQFFGVINEDGTFSLGELRDGDGIPPGQYTAWLAGVNIEEYGMDENDRDWRRVEVIMDKKFESPRTSGLSFEISTKRTNIEITVERPQETAPRGRR